MPHRLSYGASSNNTTVFEGALVGFENPVARRPKVLARTGIRRHDFQRRLLRQSTRRDRVGSRIQFILRNMGRIH